MLCSIMTANAKVEPILFADFEGGVIPAGWTQETTGVASTLAWEVQSKAEATRPASVRRGDYRLTVVNPGTLYGSSVRLISPVMNLSQSHEPRLTFSRAALSSSGYLDTLRVYYRTSASAGWIMLNEYATPTSGNNWADEELQLPAANASYQIAFEFADGTARGLSIDEIVVESTPHCSTVSNVQISATSTDAVVAFNADGFADSVVYVVTKTHMDYPEDAKTPVAKGSLYDWYLELHGLETGTNYYLYLRSSCSENESGFTDWVETPFATKYVAALPYTDQYSNLAKQDNYAFSPELTNAALQGLQLTMDVTSGMLSTSVKDNSFIIGVVKSPDDLSSFKALDTIYMDYIFQKKYCAISLAEYQPGDGEYLAFASSFSEPNALTAGTIHLAAAPALTPNHVTLTEVKDNSV